MNFTKENIGKKTYLVYSAPENEEIDTTEMGMLTHNNIPGFATTVFSQMDREKIIKYDISSKIPVKQFFEGQVSRKKIIGVFMSIADAVISAEEYLVDADSIILDTEYIYVNVSNYETVLICLPITDKTKKNDLREFYKKILIDNRHEDGDHVTAMLNYLNNSTGFSVYGFKELLMQLSAKSVNVKSSPAKNKEKVSAEKKEEKTFSKTDVSDVKEKQPEPVVVMESSEANVQNTTNDEENKGVFGNIKKILSGKKKKTSGSMMGGFLIPGREEQIVPKDDIRPDFGIQNEKHSPIKQKKNEKPDVSMDYGDTIVYDDATEENDTEIIEKVESLQIKPYLLRVKDQKKIEITSTEFNIGRDRDYNDYIISDNRHVGRSHAKIMMEEGEWFITDLNSLNHTFVDNKQIPSEEKIKISHDSSLRFADEEYVFKLY